MSGQKLVITVKTGIADAELELAFNPEADGLGIFNKINQLDFREFLSKVLVLEHYKPGTPIRLRYYKNGKLVKSKKLIDSNPEAWK